MSERRPTSRVDTPQEVRRQLIRRPSSFSTETFGVLSEKFARFMGTPRFLIWMSVFVAVWLAWNTFAPEPAQFDPRALNYTLLTLILSLQASYAAPLILLAQNRQDDRDRVALEQDRDWLADLIADLDANRALLARLLAERLPAATWRPVEATYLAWLDLRALDLGPDPAPHLATTAKVALMSVLPFGAGEGHARLNFATSPELLTEAVDRVAAATG